MSTTSATRLYAGELDRAPKGRELPTLWGFYPSILVARMAGGGNPSGLREVIVTESDGKGDDHYYAWWCNEREEFQFVYYARGLVAMCFPYGPEIEEKQGRGRLVPVNVEIVRVVPPEEPDEQGRASK